MDQDKPKKKITQRSPSDTPPAERTVPGWTRPGGAWSGAYVTPPPPEPPLIPAPVSRPGYLSKFAKVTGKILRPILALALIAGAALWWDYNARENKKDAIIVQIVSWIRKRLVPKPKILWNNGESHGGSGFHIIRPTSTPRNNRESNGGSGFHIIRSTSTPRDNEESNVGIGSGTLTNKVVKPPPPPKPKPPAVKFFNYRKEKIQEPTGRLTSDGRRETRPQDTIVVTIPNNMNIKVETEIISLGMNKLGKNVTNVKKRIVDGDEEYKKKMAETKTKIRDKCGSTILIKAIYRSNYYYVD